MADRIMMEVGEGVTERPQRVIFGWLDLSRCAVRCDGAPHSLTSSHANTSVMGSTNDRTSAGLLALSIGLVMLLAWSGAVSSSDVSAQTAELCAGALLLTTLCVLAHALHQAARKVGSTAVAPLQSHPRARCAALRCACWMPDALAIPRHPIYCPLTAPSMSLTCMSLNLPSLQASPIAGVIDLVSSLALWLAGGVIVQLLVVCAGAPLLSQSAWGMERLALVLVLSALVWLPVAQRLGGDAHKWQREFFLCAPAVTPSVAAANPPSLHPDAAPPNGTATSIGATVAPSRSLPPSLPSLSSLFGCCLLSLLLPLDWGTRWQCFPTPNLLGASLGYVCGAGVIAFGKR